MRSPKGICLDKIVYPYRIEQNPDIIKFYNTDVFIQLNGNEYPYYEYLHQIPSNLPDQQEIAISRDGVKTEFGLNYQARLYVAFEEPTGKLISKEEAEKYDYPLPIWVVYIVVIGVLTGLLIATFFAFRRVFLIPCGESGKEREIDECRKLIIAPNCEWILYDSCEAKVVARGGVTIVELIKYTLIGLIAIGGIYLAIKLFPSKEKT